MSRQLPETREMIASLIATPSVSCTHADLDMSNRSVIDLVANWSESLGFNTEIQAIDDRKFNLIATTGKGSDGLVLSGHTDTVPCNPSKWESDPYQLEERDNRLYGLGTCDMKSFLALARNASSQFDFRKFKKPLTIVATADEESTMSGARLIADNGKKLGRYCVIGEPTDLTPIHKHKGVLSLAIHYIGQSGHASDPSLGNNALDAMHEFMTLLIDYRAKIQQQFNDPAFIIPTPTLNLGHIHGGDNSNRICGDCRLFIDIRYLPSMSLNTLVKDIDELAQQIASKRNIAYHYDLLGDGLPAMDTDSASEIAEALTFLSGKPSSSVAFGTEAPYFNSMNTETMILGPGSIDQAHQPNEYLPIEQIDPTIHLVSKLIQRFCM